MRKISANLILPVSSPPLRNGIILVNPDGSIAELVDTGGNLREEPGLEFYAGTITPGFILPWFRLDEHPRFKRDIHPANTAGLTGSDDPMRNKTEADQKHRDKIAGLIEILERDLNQNGIKGIGLVLPESLISAGGLEQMSKSSLFFHPVIELCPNRNEDEFMVFNRGIDLVSSAWNDFNLSCSLTACSHTGHQSDIGKFIDEYGRSHDNILPPEEDTIPPVEDTVSPAEDFVPPKGDKLSDENPLNLLKNSLARNPEINFEELILNLTRDAAAKIFEEDVLGKIETGKKPGLNLISGYSAPESGDDPGVVPGNFQRVSNSSDEYSVGGPVQNIGLKVLV